MAERNKGAGQPGGLPRDAGASQEARLRDRVVELEQQVSALRLAAERGEMALAQFADLYDYAPVGYLTIDAAGVIRRVNVPAAALLGGSRQSLSGVKLVTIVRASDKAAFSAFVKAAFRETNPQSVEVGLVRGKWRAEHLEFIASPAASGRDLGHPGAQARLAVLDVSARRKAEEALRESRDRFRAVIASMAEGVVVHDAQGAIQECNAAAQRILDLTEDEILGRRSVDPEWRVIHEDGSPFPGAEHPAMVVLRTGRPQWNVPMGVHRPDGTVAWLRVNADPLRDAAGQVRGAVATFTDVTEDRRRAAEREVLLQRLSVVIDGSDDGFWDWDVRSGVVTFSRRFAGIVGHDLGELEPSVAAWERLAHPDDRERAWAALRRHLAGETERHVVEMRLRHKDGRWLSVVVRGKVVARDESGQPLRMAGTVTDVTRNVETERALAASEERYRDLLERNPEGIVVLQDDKVVLANQAAARIAGFGSPEDFVGTGPQDRLDAANLLAVRGATLRALAGEVVRPFDIAFPMPDGGSRIVETTGASVQFAGRPAVQVLFRDVSELRAAQAQAQVASRLQALGTFVAGMAHEFNNPLAGALANDAVAVEMIREAQREVRRDGAMDRVRIDRDLDEVLASLEDSKAAMQRIALLVKDLVTFGRPDGGRTRVGLGEVLDQAVRSLATAQVDVPGLTVEKGETPEVEASFGQLTHLVIGLVANAARAIPRGRAGSVRVRIGNGHPGMARLEVSDDGVGMAPEVLARVFDPFFSTREVGQGLGMGLALAHAIVTDHGGTISARSEVGKGSTFIVDLPAAHPADAAAS